MVTKTIYIIFIAALLTLSSCTPIDYQTFKIDNLNKEISIISSDEFVIDSISVERFGSLYFSKSLKDKSKGESKIALDKSNNEYQVYIDSLSVLKCDTDNLSLDIVIRKKGSTIKVTKEMAMNFKHLDEIQILRGLKYEHCSKQIDTLESERRYK
jgi:hypothetical protein